MRWLVSSAGPGSGKSTADQADSTSVCAGTGRVLIDGVDLALVEPAWLRRQVGVILQENFLFNCSVRENIALADPGLPMELVMAAARSMGHMISSLNCPKGMTPLVERTWNQPVRRAAPAYRDRPRPGHQPGILIPTRRPARFDYESERIVQQNMRAISKRAGPKFIIAHRLSAVRNADRSWLTRPILVEQGGLRSAATARYLRPPVRDANRPDWRLKRPRPRYSGPWSPRTRNLRSGGKNRSVETEVSAGGWRSRSARLHRPGDLIFWTILAFFAGDHPGGYQRGRRRRRSRRAGHSRVDTARPCSRSRWRTAAIHAMWTGRRGRRNRIELTPSSAQADVAPPAPSKTRCNARSCAIGNLQNGLADGMPRPRTASIQRR